VSESFKYKHAKRRGGGRIEFEVSNPAGVGGMKQVFFEKGRKRVVAFFHGNLDDPMREERLRKVIEEFNPTIDGKPYAEYWREVFCWPTEIVDHGELGVGIVLPAYLDVFIFREGNLKGREKSGGWFNNRDRRTGRAFRHVHVHPSERGDLRGMAQAMECAARAIRRMHNAGLVHSDLSESNVLVDPASGRALIVDVDALVVTGLYPPEVIGTPGYIAPEVLKTKNLPVGHPGRIQPSADTDKHALAVMIYRFLLERHPLEGRRVFPGRSAEEEDELKFGSEALYCEHPANDSNRPESQNYRPASVVGPELAELFRRAFVDGLAKPHERPTPGEWEAALARAIDIMIRCSNADCDQGWFVHRDQSDAICPFCATSARERVKKLCFEREDKPGWFRRAGDLVLNVSAEAPIGTVVRRHHIDRFAPRGPGEDPAALARVRWLDTPVTGAYLENLALPGLEVREGLAAHAPRYHSVPVGSKVFLTHDLELRFGSDGGSVRARVVCL
jgi:hypothetical protein